LISQIPKKTTLFLSISNLKNFFFSSDTEKVKERCTLNVLLFVVWKFGHLLWTTVWVVLTHEKQFLLCSTFVRWRQHTWVQRPLKQTIINIYIQYFLLESDYASLLGVRWNKESTFINYKFQVSQFYNTILSIRYLLCNRGVHCLVQWGRWIRRRDEWIDILGSRWAGVVVDGLSSRTVNVLACDGLMSRRLSCRVERFTHWLAHVGICIMCNSDFGKNDVMGDTSLQRSVSCHTVSWL